MRVQSRNLLDELTAAYEKMGDRKISAETLKIGRVIEGATRNLAANTATVVRTELRTAFGDRDELSDLVGKTGYEVAAYLRALPR